MDFRIREARPPTAAERRDQIAGGGATEIQGDVAGGGAAEQSGQRGRASRERGKIHPRVFRGNPVRRRGGELGVERTIERAAVELRLRIGNFEMAPTHGDVGVEVVKHDGTDGELIDREAARGAEILWHGIGGRVGVQKWQHTINEAFAPSRV